MGLLLFVFLAYAPSLHGGFLNYDDPWMVAESPFYKSPGFDQLSRIWTDFSKQTRLTLGAEYLPLRDTSVWLEAATFGLVPQAMRSVNLALYLGGIALLVLGMRRALGNSWRTDVLVGVFALHPIHAESVAWIVGRKDVLGLLFFAAGLYLQAGNSKNRILWVPLLTACAQLSKVLFVVSVALFVAQDLLRGRRFRAQLPLYLATAAVSLLIIVAQTAIARDVGMAVEPPGGSRLTAIMTMGPAWLDVLQALVWPPSLSIVREVPTLTHFTASSIAGIASVFLSLGACLWLWLKRSLPVFLVAWIWIFAPLTLVSQVLVPLQNRMADRYLLLSVMGAALVFWWALHLLRRGKAVILSITLLALLWVGSIYRGILFSDSTLVFEDATGKTNATSIAPYQLGQAKEAKLDVAGAIAAYELAIARNGQGHDESARRSVNNAARLLAKQGKLPKAEEYLRYGRRQWPDDPKILANLVKVVARNTARQNEARALHRELMTRFPDYASRKKSGRDEHFPN